MGKQTRQVSIFINGKEVENTIKGIAAEQVKLNNTLKGMIRGTEEYENTVRQLQGVNGIIAEHNQKLKGIQQGWNLTKIGVDKFVGIAAGAFAVDSLLTYGKSLYGVGVQMDTLVRKAKTVFGEALPQVSAEAQKNARDIGLTTQQYISAAAAIQDLLIPMGFQRKEAAGISTQLVNLSGALSEWTGGQINAEQVSGILTKALLGEREELKQLGISLSDADVKAGLAARGLDKLTGAALEQAKASTTLELILAKSTDAQAAFADGSESAVRRQAQLAAKVAEVTEKLATLLLPVFESLAAIAGSVTDGISGIVSVVGDLVDPAQAASKAFDEQAANVANLNDNIAPLLDRYDVLTGKTTLTAAEQDELKKIINKVSEAIPGAVSGFDQYGVALGLNTQAARDFIEVEKARLQFVNSEAIKKNQDALNEYQTNAANINKVIDGLQRNLEQFKDTATDANKQTINYVIGQKAKELQDIQKLVVGVNAEINRLQGGNLAAPAPGAPPKPGGTTTGGGKAKVKEAQETEAQIVEFAKRRAEVLARLNAVQRQAEKDTAAESLDIQERLFDRYVDTAENKKLVDIDYEKERLAAEETINQATNDALILSVEATRAQYEQLLLLAEQYGLDTIELKKRLQEEENAALDQITGNNNQGTFGGLAKEFETKKAQIEKFYLDKKTAAIAAGLDIAEIERQQAARSLELNANYNKQKLELFSTTFQGIANSFVEAFSLFSDSEHDFVVFQKALAIAQIAIDTATAISGIISAAASTSITPIDLAIKITSGIGIVLANIAKAKKLLDTPIPVKQKYTGGVLGADDGRYYNATAISAPNTGMLPHYPVVFNSNATAAPVLASERGAEYFVASQDLRNPYVANLVKMIDLATHGGRGIPQFADGGVNATTTPPTVTQSTPDFAAVIEANTRAMNALLAMMQQGVIAVVPDGTVLDINQRFKKLNEISGGYFG